MAESKLVCWIIPETPKWYLQIISTDLLLSIINTPGFIAQHKQLKHSKCLMLHYFCILSFTEKGKRNIFNKSNSKNFRDN